VASTGVNGDGMSVSVADFGWFDVLTKYFVNLTHSQRRRLVSFCRLLGYDTRYEGWSHRNLKLHVASGAAIFTLLLRRRVAFLHLTATCRPLFKPSVTLLSTYRQSSCVSNFYRNLKVFSWLSLVIF